MYHFKLWINEIRKRHRGEGVWFILGGYMTSVKTTPAVSLTKNFNPYCSVLGDSRNGFELYLHKHNNLFHNRTIMN